MLDGESEPVVLTFRAGCRKLVVWKGEEVKRDFLSHLSLLKNTALFYGIEEKDLGAMLDCLQAEKRSYGRNDPIYQIGDLAEEVGLVLSGKVCIYRDDFWGNRSILDHVGPGQIFGETYACLRTEELQVSVMALEQTEVLLLDVKRILHTCTSACSFHQRLLRNLMQILARKNLMLTQKVQHMSKRTLRDKLLSYLSACSQERHSQAFTIPFNRQQLADYLSVDRSALSNALCHLRDEGILQFDRNHFILLKETEDFRSIP